MASRQSPPTDNPAIEAPLPTDASSWEIGEVDVPLPSPEMTAAVISPTRQRDKLRKAIDRLANAVEKRVLNYETFAHVETDLANAQNYLNPPVSAPSSVVHPRESSQEDEYLDESLPLPKQLERCLGNRRARGSAVVEMAPGSSLYTRDESLLNDDSIRRVGNDTSKAPTASPSFTALDNLRENVQGVSMSGNQPSLSVASPSPRTVSTTPRAATGPPPPGALERNIQKPPPYSELNHQKNPFPPQFDGAGDERPDGFEPEERKQRKRRLSELKHCLNAVEKADTDRLSEPEAEYDPRRVVDPVDKGLESEDGSRQDGRGDSTKPKFTAEHRRSLSELDRWRREREVDRERIVSNQAEESAEGDGDRREG